MNELTKKIKVKFNKFVTKVYESFNNSRSVDHNSLVLILTEQEALFERGDLSGVKTVSDVFIAIKPYCSFFNYDVIERLVRVKGSQKEKGYLQKYLQSFSAYCKAMPCAETVCGNEDTKSKRTKLKFKLDYDRQLKPDIILSIKYKIASNLGIRPSALYLCQIRDGCILLEFLVPTFIVEHIFPLNNTQKIALHRDIKLLSIECETLPLVSKLNFKFDFRV